MHFQQHLPRKPYCADELQSGLIIRNKLQASSKRYIQHNEPNSKLWLAFDIDRPTHPEEAYEMGLPLPNLWIQNPINRHAHLLYSLSTPVHLNINSSVKAQRFAAAVQVAMTIKLEADINYAGLICKNPLHPYWNTISPNDNSYDLGYLADFVDLNLKEKRKDLPAIGWGRNVALFDRTRAWAYQAVRNYRAGNFNAFHDSVLTKTMNFNDFSNPLAMSEVKATAKSIAKWVWKKDGQAEANFIERQRLKQKKSVAARFSKTQDTRQEVAELYKKGVSISDIGRILKLSRPTIYRWLE